MPLSWPSMVVDLVGNNSGTIYNSYVTGSVSNVGSAATGGLVGDNNRGTINKSYTTATVTASSSADDIFLNVGGLVGNNNTGSIINSYATGAVTASHTGHSSIQIGGLVGYNNIGPITNSYATGAVSASHSSSVTGETRAGGLVGRNKSGFVENSYATGEVSLSVQSNQPSITYVGGLMGSNQAGFISDSYARGNVSGAGEPVHVGGLIGYNGKSLHNSYAMGSISTTSPYISGRTSINSYQGGLVGSNTNNGTITGTHYFVSNSGGTDGISSGSCSGTCEKKTSAELQSLTSVSDWSTDDWSFGANQQLPHLKYGQRAVGYCSQSSYTTQEDCEAPGGYFWFEGGDECGGDTGVVCGEVIPGQ